MATETTEKSLAYAEGLDATGTPIVHYVRTFGKLDGSHAPMALCGAAAPDGWSRVAFVQVEGYRTAITAATCPACVTAAGKDRVPVGA